MKQKIACACKTFVEREKTNQKRSGLLKQNNLNRKLIFNYKTLCDKKDASQSSPNFLRFSLLMTFCSVIFLDYALEGKPFLFDSVQEVQLKIKIIKNLKIQKS